MGKKIGILALQGALEEHEAAIRTAAEALDIDVSTVRINRTSQLSDIDAVVLPGGESTSMKSIGRKLGLFEPLAEKIRDGMPAFGTCAGAILLAKEVRRKKGEPITTGVMPILDMVIIRNGYGRQRESFEVPLSVPELDLELDGVFIRAPIIEKVEDGVKVLATFEDQPVLVEQENVLASTFHPELSNTTAIHKYFLKKIL